MALISEKKMNDFCKKWNGWGIVVMWTILALVAIPLPFLIDYLTRVVFKIF